MALTSEQTVAVAFVIPHRGRFDMLVQTVESITALTGHDSTIHICVVTQENAEQLKSLLSSVKIAVSVIAADAKASISELRNIGTAATDSDYVAFLDADVALTSNWLAEMLALLSRDGPRPNVIASAHQLPGERAPVLEKIRVALSNAAVDCEVVFLPGRNLFLRRQDVLEIGGFPPKLLTCEDYYFTEQASRKGPLYYSSQAGYVHLGEDKTYRDLFKKEIWRAQSNLQSIKGRHVPLREWPSFIVPFVVALFALGLVLSLLFACWVWALFCLVGFALPIVAYATRLKLKSDNLPFGQLLKFYGIYFMARAYGTVLGLFKAVNW